MERRLIAIMATDVVGYARLIRADEEGTVAALKVLRADLVDPKLIEHDGRVVKLMGDGMLAEFPSPVQAVRAAIAIQRAMNAGSREPKIQLRIGINLGDVIVDGDDIHGDGVNVAARMESLAMPGAICVSDSVYEQVRDRFDLPFRDLGERQVKNIDRPIRAWQLDDAVGASPGVAAAAAPSSSGQSATAAKDSLFERPAVLVAPFETIGADREDQYLARGVSEDVGSTLSYWRWMPVIGLPPYRIRKPAAICRALRDLSAPDMRWGEVSAAPEAGCD